MSLGIEDFLQCNFGNLFCFILVGEMAMEFIILQMKVEAPVKNQEKTHNLPIRSYFHLFRQIGS